VIRRLEEKDPTVAEHRPTAFLRRSFGRETAAMLDVSERTVKREWAFARAWLF
jgi:hypothetical protein